MEKNKSKYQLKQVDVRLRLVNRKPLPSDREIVNPEDAVRLLAKAMADLDREHLFVINLDAAGHPLNYGLVSIGDVRNAFVSMQSLFKSALLCNASNILAVHLCKALHKCSYVKLLFM
jgi:DNA repair protein RadC